MNKLQNLTAFFTFIALCSCNENSNSKINNPPIDSTPKIDTFAKKDTSNPEHTTDFTALINEKLKPGTFTSAKFDELTLSIHHFTSTDAESNTEDTVKIIAEIGENLEGQMISIYSEVLTDITVEQCFETSISISNDGGHRDLTNWKHFYSNWKPLQADYVGHFVCEKYTKKEKQQFPKITIYQLKQKVKEDCGDVYFQLIENIKTPYEYPSSVGISRYYLKIIGKRLDNKQMVSKIVSIEIPMGC